MVVVADKLILPDDTPTLKDTGLVLPISFVDVSVNSTVEPLLTTEVTVPAL